MANLIDRQQAIDYLAKTMPHDDYGYELSEDEARKIWADIINKIPSAEPQERKTGKWIDTYGNAEWYAREYRCSECGDTMLGDANFCPNCGCKMEVDNETD